LAIVLAGLTALLAGCGGGGEEAGVLAVAFRLDEGSPVMSAYVGDPTKDPFLLPAGRYYVEALNQDEVVFSRSVVDSDGVRAVGFLPTMGSPGVVEPPPAEPILTLANFLVDADLAEYAFLEIATGGFKVSPFDAAVQVEAADVEGLFGLYGDILGQKDGVLAALSQIQARASVSGAIPYVSSRWAKDGKGLDRTYDRLLALYQLLRPADLERQLRTDEEAEVALAKETAWIISWNEDLNAGVSTPGLQLSKTPELLEKHKQWEKYAKELVGDIEDEASAQRAQERLTDKIAGDLEPWFEKGGGGVPPEIVDEIVDYFVKDLLHTAGGPAGTPQPAAAGTAMATPTPTLVVTPVVTPVRTPTPAEETPAATVETTATPALWIEGYVQGVADQWLAKGYSGIDVAVYADDLRQCLRGSLQSGFSEEGAKAQCPPSQFEPIATPQPTETPPPPAETPTPEPTATPTPQPQDVTAVGQFLYAPPGETVVGNTATLKFNAGGDVTLEGRLDTRGPESQYCDPYFHFLSLDCDGAHALDSGAFAGTCQTQSGTTSYSAEFTGPDQWVCQAHNSGASGSGPWQATLEGTVVKGSYGDLQFELTVQGQ
jgi:hypothetical protein